MDPGGSELDSSLPQPENLCLIVEDSQPDSVALEDDPETSYRALLARRLSSLQPAARSPVLVGQPHSSSHPVVPNTVMMIHDWAIQTNNSLLEVLV